MSAKRHLRDRVLECRAGYYRKSGDATRQCQADGRWNGNPLTCSKWCKSTKQTPRNVTSSSQCAGAKVDQVCTESCSKGFERVEGLTSRVCGADGEFKEVRSCVPRFQRAKLILKLVHIPET